MNDRPTLDKGAVARAMGDAERRRMIHHASPPGDGRSTWRIRLTELDDPFDLTWREAHVFALGLAAGRRAGRAEVMS